MSTKKNRTNSKTFKDDDLLDNESFADNLINHVNSQYKVLDESLVISLNGAFGCGKTWFLKMFKDRLEKDKYNVIYIDCWKEDLFSEPLITIISGIYDYISANYYDKENANKIKEYLTYAVAFARSAINQVLDAQIGIDFEKTIDGIKNGNLDTNIADLSCMVFKLHSHKKKLLNLFNEALHEFIKNLGDKPLYILVDELDRTRPDYAVHFLETLKHFFYAQGVIFIVAVNKEQLKSSVKCLYGDTLNFDEYYRKFVHRNIAFPAFTKDNIQNYITKKVDRHFTPGGDNLRFVAELNDDIKNDTIQLCLSFRLTLRQINELFRIISYFLLKIHDDNRIAIDKHLYATLIYTVVYLSNSDKCNSIMTSDNIYKEIIALFTAHHLFDSVEERNYWSEKLLVISSSLDDFNDNFNEHMILIESNLDVDGEEYIAKCSSLRSDASPGIYLKKDEQMKRPEILKISSRIEGLLHFFDDQ